MNKHLISRLTIFCLLFSLILTTCACAADSSFSDVAGNAWYADAVAYCDEQGLVSAMPDGSFSPNVPATRTMLVMGLYRQAGSPAVTAVSRFSDIDATKEVHNAVVWATENGIVSGYTDGRFGPEDHVIREQFAAILWRSANRPTPGAAEPFADQSQIAAYAVDAVAWAKSKGIIHGRDNNVFDPRANITRSEAAVMLRQWGLQSAPAQTPVSGSNTVSGDNNGTSLPPVEPIQPAPSPAPGNSILIAYFSATNNTESIANHLNAVLHADLYEIVPEVPYTSADLNYNTDCRANREQHDPNARPAISGSAENMAQYNIVFVGYPIWHGQAPKIISTFLEAYDFSSKTIVPFCTSGSSGIGSSATNLHTLAPGATWLDGRRFSGSASRSDMETWVNGLDLPAQIPEGETTMLKIEANGHTMYAAFADNTSAEALQELLRDGPLTIEMRDYANFEKVGPLGTRLPTNNEQITTQAGDLILYQGNQFVIYYAPNTWNFTRLGKINDVTADELKEILGAGDVTVTLSLSAK